MKYFFPALYLASGLTLVGGAAAANVMAYDPGAVSAERRPAPPSARVSNPARGGAVYRPPPIFWYGGVAGGK